MLAQADTMNYICNRILKTAKQNINNLKRYIMKKFTSILAMIMMAAMSLTFVSCDDDEYIADTLWGVWEGDMYVTSEWNGHTYYSSYSILAFDKDPYEYASGTGYWIDYYSDAPWDYFASHIEWRVNNRNIEIYSREDDTYFTIYATTRYLKAGSAELSLANMATLCSSGCARRHHQTGVTSNGAGTAGMATLIQTTRLQHVLTAATTPTDL